MRIIKYCFCLLLIASLIVYGKNDIGKTLRIKITNEKKFSERRQSGFLIKMRTENGGPVPGVITALHGIVAAGKQVKIYASPEDNSQHIPLTLIYVDIKRDIAFLQGELPKQWKYFTSAFKCTPGNKKIIGYPLNSTIRERVVKISNPPYSLFKRIAPNIEDQKMFDLLKKHKSPNFQVRVINISGNIYPGDSGAPILNDQKKVIGVVNGGLNAGEKKINWGIPLADIELTQSNINNPEIHKLKDSSQLLFSKEIRYVKPGLRMLLPGGGQFYKNQSTKGFLLLSAIGLSTVGFFIANKFYNDNLDKSLQTHNIDLDEALQTHNINSRLKYLDKADTWQQIGDISGILAISFYAFSLIDALLPPKNLSGKMVTRSLKFYPDLAAHSINIQYSLRF